jgi:hypothetical protein
LSGSVTFLATALAPAFNLSNASPASSAISLNVQHSTLTCVT